MFRDGSRFTKMFLKKNTLYSLKDLIFMTNDKKKILKNIKYERRLEHSLGLG